MARSFDAFPFEPPMPVSMRHAIHGRYRSKDLTSAGRHAEARGLWLRQYSSESARPSLGDLGPQERLPQMGGASASPGRRTGAVLVRQVLSPQQWFRALGVGHVKSVTDEGDGPDEGGRSGFRYQRPGRPTDWPIAGDRRMGARAPCSKRTVVCRHRNILRCHPVNDVALVAGGRTGRCRHCAIFRLLHKGKPSPSASERHVGGVRPPQLARWPPTGALVPSHQISALGPAVRGALRIVSNPKG